MKNLLLLALTLTTFVTPAFAKTQTVVAIDKPAPNFMAADTHGRQVNLSSLKGKTVVLEWTNHECPFVHKQYDSGLMQSLQKEATKDGVVWISIISSASGKEGYVTQSEANKIAKEQKASPTHIILDTTGDIGRQYNAKTTPHMFVINKAGVLAYMGAIDDKPSTDVAELPTQNYVRAALADLKANQKVKTPTTNPYGCGIKY